jgi:hypothetical protein
MNAITPITTDRNAVSRHFPDFDAVVRPIYTAEGDQIPTDIRQGIFREDTGEIIATCGGRFKPVQHRQLIDPMLDHFAEQGYDVTVQNNRPNRNSLEYLRGRKAAHVFFQTTKNGAVMRFDIILGDFIKPTGSSAYLDRGPDTMLFKISGFNSHDQSLAATVNTSYERLICMNGLTSPTFRAGIYGKHTANFSVDGMLAKISRAAEMMTQDADKFGLWATTKCDVATAEVIIKKTLARVAKPGHGKPHFNGKMLSRIMDLFAHEDQTIWGLYQAMTAWQSHGDMKDSSNPVTTTIQRETAVAKALTSDAWKAFTPA